MTKFKIYKRADEQISGNEKPCRFFLFSEKCRIADLKKNTMKRIESKGIVDEIWLVVTRSSEDGTSFDGVKGQRPLSG